MPDRKLKLRGDDPRFNEPIMRGDCRVISILSSGKWQWKTDGLSVVVIYDPDMNRYQIPYWTALGLTQKEFDDLDAKRSFDDSPIVLYPSDVKDYIMQNLHEPR